MLIATTDHNRTDASAEAGVRSGEAFVECTRVWEMNAKCIQIEGTALE